MIDFLYYMCRTILWTLFIVLVGAVIVSYWV